MIQYASAVRNINDTLVYFQATLRRQFFQEKVYIEFYLVNLLPHKIFNIEIAHSVHVWMYCKGPCSIFVCMHVIWTRRLTPQALFL